MPLDIQAVEQVYARFGAALTAGDAEILLAILSSDAEICPPNAPPVRGKSAAHTWVKDFLKRYGVTDLRLAMRKWQIGDRVAMFAYDATGNYVPRDGRPRVPFSQNYVDVWTLRADHSWKICMHTWNSSQPGPSIWE